MKEVRLCWTEGTSPLRGHSKHCGPWMIKSGASLEVLETMRIAGCATFGFGSHWLAERNVRPAQSLADILRTR